MSKLEHSSIRPAAALALSLLLSLTTPLAHADRYDQAQAQPTRSAADRERDARDKPAEVLRFAGIQPGMVVADVFGAGGYYSELLARVVGPQGKVHLINNAPYVRFAGRDLETRLADQRLPNVVASVVPNTDLGLAENSLDAAILIMTLHDLFYENLEHGWEQIDRSQFFGQLRRALKPGAVLLVTDHSAAAGKGAELAKSLHRLEEVHGRRELEAHGFVFDGAFEGLRNPADPLDQLVFDPKIRGRTDRWVHRYRNPG